MAGRLRGWSLCGFILLVCTNPLGAQNRVQDEMGSRSELQFSVFWEAAGPLPFFVTVTESPDKDGEYLPERTLEITSDKGEHAVKLLTFTTPDIPISLMVLGIHRHLVSIWESGSAYRLRIHVSNGDQISLALDLGSDGFPEFVSDSRGNEIFIVRDGKQGNARAKIYSWFEGRFQLADTVPWNERFRGLPK